VGLSDRSLWVGVMPLRAFIGDEGISGIYTMGEKPGSDLRRSGNPRSVS